MKKTIRKIKAYIKLQKTKRLFRKEKVKDWQEYYTKYDTLFDKESALVNKKYEKYACKVILTPDFKQWQAAVLWCHYNCKSKYRYDIFSVVKQSKINDTNYLEDEYVVVPVGGLHPEILVIAFTDERDYAWFSLKWL